MSYFEEYGGRSLRMLEERDRFANARIRAIGGLSIGNSSREQTSSEFNDAKVTTKEDELQKTESFLAKMKYYWVKFIEFNNT